MFVVTIAVETKPTHSPAFLARVRQQASDSLEGELGCHRFDVCVDPERSERVFLYEMYTNAAAFRTHLGTVHFEAFDRDAGPTLLLKTVEVWELQA